MRHGGGERRPLTDNEYIAAILDPCVFVDRYCWIRGKGGKTVRFRITGNWQFQTPVLEAMDSEDLLIVLKARQLGISWTADAYALWRCVANRGQTILILSRGMREAQIELERIRFMHRFLPPELKLPLGDQVPMDERQPDNTMQISFPTMDSRILSLASVDDAGTSFTATCAIVQELSKIDNATSLMAGLKPTVADDGKMILVSTAKGYSGEFYDTWKANGHRWKTGMIVGERGGEGDYTPVFIPWHARPGRSERWYQATLKTLDLRRMRQEYPATPEEAFQGTSESVFAEEFSRGDVSVDGIRHPESTFPVVSGLDPGVNNAFGYLIEVMGDSVFVFSEVHVQNGATSELGAAVAQEYRRFGLDPGEGTSYVDPAASARNMQTLQTDMDVLAECGLAVEFEPVRYSPAQRVSQIKAMLKNSRVWISLDCPKLLDALEQAPWATKRAPGGGVIKEDTYAKDGKYEHPLDAFGYALCQLYPPNVDPAGEAADPDIRGADTAYSGSEFG